MRYATPDVKFSVKEVDIGIAADVGSLSRLPKIVGAGSWVKDVCLSGRVFGAEEARGYGFVSRVVEGGKAECVREGVRWATMIAGKSPVAVQGTKELLNFSRDHSVAEGECGRRPLCGEELPADKFLKCIQASATRLFGTALRCKLMM